MSSKEGQQAVNNINLMSESSGREIGEDGTVINTADATKSIRNLEDISGQNALVSIFGDAIVAQRVPFIASQFFFGVQKSGVVEETTGSAYATIAGTLGKENKLRLGTGTTPGSKRSIESLLKLGYIPGCEFGIWFTTVFLQAPTSLTGYSRAGMYDENDGFWVGWMAHEGEMKSGLSSRKDGVDTFIPRENFNVDPLDGTGPSRMNLQELTGNIVHIRGGYLGFAPIIYEVITEEGLIVPFHIIKYPNTSPETHVSNTRLPAKAEVYNGDAAEDVILDVGSLQMYLIDGADTDINTRKFANGLAGSFTPVSDTRKVWVSYRNKSTYQGYLQPSPKTNNVPTVVTFLDMTISGQNKTGLIEILVLTDDDLSSGTWTDQDTDDSVVQYSVNATYDATALANAKAVFAKGFPAGATGDFSFTQNIEDYLPQLQPGQHRVYVITSDSQAFSYTHSIAWKEFF